jgi:hypothetical protein
MHSSPGASTIGPLAAAIIRYCALYHTKNDLRIDAGRRTIYVCVCGNMWAYLIDILYIYTYIPARERFYEGIYFTLPYLFDTTL